MPDTPKATEPMVVAACRGMRTITAFAMLGAVVGGVLGLTGQYQLAAALAGAIIGGAFK